MTNTSNMYILWLALYQCVPQSRRALPQKPLVKVWMFFEYIFRIDRSFWNLLCQFRFQVSPHAMSVTVQTFPKHRGNLCIPTSLRSVLFGKLLPRHRCQGWTMCHVKTCRRGTWNRRGMMGYAPGELPTIRYHENHTPKVCWVCPQSMFANFQAGRTWTSSLVATSSNRFARSDVKISWGAGWQTVKVPHVILWISWHQDRHWHRHHR